MKRILVGSLVFVLMSLCIASAEEKKPASPQQTKEQVEAMMDAMLPQLTKYVEIMMNAHLTMLSKPETAEKIARYIKNLQDALIKEGYSKEDALRIATTLPLPTVPSSK